MKKRAMAIFFSLVLLCSIALASDASADTMYVNTSNGKSLNLRDYPSKDGNIISSLPYGSAVEVDTGFVGGSWAHVYLSGVEGYCMYRYLTDYQPGPKPKPTKTATPTQRTDLYSNFVDCNYNASVRPSSPGGYVHMRWAPSKNQPVHRDYYNGDNLLVIAQNGEWCQVYDQASNQSGFMMASCLQVEM